MSNYVCLSLSAQAARDLIHERAMSAMKNIGAIKPYKVDGPVTIEIERTTRNALEAAAWGRCGSAKRRRDYRCPHRKVSRQGFSRGVDTRQALAASTTKNGAIAAAKHATSAMPNNDSEPGSGDAVPVTFVVVTLKVSWPLYFRDPHKTN